MHGHRATKYRYPLVALIALLFCACGSAEDNNNTANNANNGSNNASNNGSNSSNNATNVPPPCELNLADGEAFETLGEYCFFRGDIRIHAPSEGVVPYNVLATLYADDSLKTRFLVLPPDGKIEYSEREAWEFPIGSVLIKSFYLNVDDRDLSLGQQIVETRLLVHEPQGWEPYTYLWNEAQDEAVLHQVGKWVDMEWIDGTGADRTLRYRVPNKNQCKNCHGQDDFFEPLGPSSRQLNLDYDFGNGPENQIEYFDALGLLSETPPPPGEIFTLADPQGTESLERRARSYLDANCAHCHNLQGSAGASGLQLSIFVEEPNEYGVCRRPVAAGGGSGGFDFDIKPGDADQSIMVFRMSSVDPEIKMPEIPTQTSDVFGVDLISSWINSLPPSECEDL